LLARLRHPSLVSIQPVFTDAARPALAGYRGLTHEAFTVNLRQFSGRWRPSLFAALAGTPLDL
jgi:hypothetical protein